MQMVNLRIDHVRLLVVTHAHADHFGQALPIVERSGCDLWMNPNLDHARAYAEDPDGAFRRRIEVARQSGVPSEPLDAYAERRKEQGSGIAGWVEPARDAVEGVTFATDHGEWRVLETPGHAPSHVCLHQPERRCSSPATTCSAASRSTTTTAGRPTRPASSWPRWRDRRARRPPVPERPRPPLHRRARARPRPTGSSSPIAWSASARALAAASPAPPTRSSPRSTTPSSPRRRARGGWPRPCATSRTCSAGSVRRRPSGADERWSSPEHRAALVNRLDADRRARRRAAREPVFSFEFFPPKTPEGERNLQRALDALSTLEPDFASVTYGAGGSTRDRRWTSSRASRTTLRHRGHGPPQLRRRDRRRAARDPRPDPRRRDRQRARPARRPARGRDRVAPRTPAACSYSPELAGLIAADYDFAIGAACFPEVHPEAPDLAHDLRFLREKVERRRPLPDHPALLRQPALLRLRRRGARGRDRRPDHPRHHPITNVDQIKRFTQRCGASIPADLHEALDGHADEPDSVLELGVAYATLQCADLLARGAPGIHFYMLNKAPSARAILGALRAAAPVGALPPRARLVQASASSGGNRRASHRLWRCPRARR